MTDKRTTSTENSQGGMIICQSEHGGARRDVRLVDETAWLTQALDLYAASVDYDLKQGMREDPTHERR